MPMVVRMAMAELAASTVIRIRSTALRERKDGFNCR